MPTAYRRPKGKECSAKAVEFGEQILAKPKRNPRTTRKQSLKSRWVDATYVGASRSTNEHIVVLPEGGAAIRCRTIRRKPSENRWDKKAIEDIVAGPRNPNPKDWSQFKPESESATKGIQLEAEGASIPKTVPEEVGSKVRDFKVTKDILSKFGRSEDCPGCEASKFGYRRVHNPACRKRLMERMKLDPILKGRIDSRNQRCGIEENPVQEDKDEDEDSPKVLDPSENVEVEADSDYEKEVSDSEKEDDAVLKQSEVAEEVPKVRKREDDEGEESSKRARLRAVREKRLLMRRSIGNVCRKINRQGEYSKVERMIVDLETQDDELTKIGFKGSQKLDCTEIMKNLMKLESAYADPHEDPDDQLWTELYRDMVFMDDLNGGEVLDWHKVVQARRLEIEYFKKMRVYEKCPRSEAKKLGKKVITTRWIDTNKGDKAKPDYRSRLVGREIKTDARLDLFAATPPLETFKYLIARCAMGQSRRNPLRIATIDIKRAYFYAPCIREVFIEIPREDFEPGDEGMVAKLRLSLYGTRDVAQNWTAAYTSHLVKLGFNVGRSSPCNFYHSSKEICLTVHGDDFLVVAPQESLEWLRTKMEAQYAIKYCEIGPEVGKPSETRILNRIIRWTDSGIEYEADQRHAEAVIDSMGVKDSKSLCTPGIAETGAEAAEAEVELMGSEMTKFRSVCARVNFLSQDRPELQFASGAISSSMSKPTESAMKSLKRMARFLNRRSRLIQWFPFGSAPEEVEAFADSDWAGNRKNARSTSGGVVKFGGHVVKTWSSRQKTIALSSGEAELYALTKASCQAIGMISLAADFGCQAGAMIRSDSTAAIGIAHRQGLGRTRHIDVQYLWIQEKLKGKEFQLSKVGTNENIADLMTKHLSSEVMNNHIAAMNMYYADGRSDAAPEVKAIYKNKAQRKAEYQRCSDDAQKRRAERCLVRLSRRSKRSSDGGE